MLLIVTFVKDYAPPFFQLTQTIKVQRNVFLKHSKISMDNQLKTIIHFPVLKTIFSLFGLVEIYFIYFYIYFRC